MAAMRRPRRRRTDGDEHVTAGAGLSTIVETMGDAFVVMDDRGRITDWNLAAERMFGWARAEVLGRRVADALVPPELRAAHADAVARFVLSGERTFTDPVEMPALHRDGGRLTVELTLTARPADGQWRAYGFVRDVTRRKRAEEQLHAAQAEAERANSAKSDFLARMSHELRTPLNAVIGFAQLLALEDPDPRQREAIGHIVAGGEHLRDLVTEVLDLARAESGQLGLTLERVPVDDVVAEAVDLVRPLAAQHQVRLPDRGHFVSGLYVHADRQRVRQILLNLLSNAVKYNRHPGAVSLTCRSATPHRVQVAVTDTGPGIPPHLRDRLFVPFDRLDAAHTEIEGTGLGLALTHRLADAMAGRIDLDSTPGLGSTFTLDLPDAATGAVPPAGGHRTLTIPTGRLPSAAPPPSPRHE